MSLKRSLFIFSEGERSVDLIKAKLKPVNSIICSLLYNTSLLIPEGILPSMFCAEDYDSNGQKDTCDGDSGSPIQIIDNDCLYKIIGITSFGHLCGLPGFSGVYIRVSHYINWIKSIASQQCPNYTSMRKEKSVPSSRKNSAQ